MNFHFKFTIQIIFLLFSFQFLNAQEKDTSISIVVSGIGKNQDDAIKSALRTSIERVLSSFIIINSEILKDTSFYDDINLYSGGSINKYKILNSTCTNDSNWIVNINASISIEKFAKFIKSKGIDISYNSSLNFKQQILNEEAELDIVYNMIGYLHEIMQKSFDYYIKCDNPISTDDINLNWEIPINVTVKTNKNMDYCANYFINTLSALGLTNKELIEYKNFQKSIYSLNVNYKGLSKKIYLRNLKSIYAINTLNSNWEFYTRHFLVEPYSNDFLVNFKKKLHEFSKCYKNEHSYYICGYTNSEFNDYNIYFLTSDQIAATYSWNDKKQLSQIEKISQYRVKPKGITSKFKNGGILVYEENNHGLVMSLIDLGYMTWDNSKYFCENLLLSNYSDWYLPNKDELIKLFNFKTELLGGFKCPLSENYTFCYWSSDEIDDKHAFFINFEFNSFNSKMHDARYYKFQNYNVRPVRKF